MKRAVFSGSFDPITLGHYNTIQRGLSLFDEIVVAIGSNADKKYLFSLEERKAFIENAFEGESRIKTAVYEGLTVDFCKKIQAPFILRGLRNALDFEYEKAIANANEQLAGIETVFLLATPEFSFISSSIVRDVIRHGGDYSILVPESVNKRIS